MAAAATLQLAYTGKNWNLAAACSRNDSNVRFPGTPVSLEILPTTGTDTGYTNPFALSGFWQPFQSGWLPSISAGAGLNRIFYSGRNTLVSSEELGYRAASVSWMAAPDGSKPSGDCHKQKDQNFAMELYYRMAISDQITITPAPFWFSRPQGQYTFNYGPGTDNRGSPSSLGGLI